jgi:hypothetical protein
MRRMKAFGAAALVLAALCVSTDEASAQNVPEASRVPYEYNYRLPIWGERLAKRGITFPLPGGVGLNYTWLNQPIRIDGLQVALNDSEFVSLDEIVEFDRVESTVHALNARVDLWLFPFLNLYALGNYAPLSDTDVHLSEPFPMKAGAIQPGGGGGLGTTLAMGAWGFFATLDFNWTRNKMQKLDAPVSTLLFAPRVGRKLFKIGKIELTAWIGTMFQRIGVDTSGKIRLSDAIGEPSDEVLDKVNDWYEGLPPGRQALVSAFVDELRAVAGDDPVVRYRLNKQVEQPWNMLVGTQLELTENWQIRAEVGFIKRTQVIAGLNYRFGMVPRSSKP